MLGIIGGTLLTLLTPSLLHAQGGDYGTNRQLRTCPSRSAPTRGKIGTAQAKLYAACAIEDNPVRMSGTRNFVDILSLQVGKARRVNISDIQKFSSYKIDTEQPIYDLQGSVVGYTCFNIGIGHAAGANCTISRVPKSPGICFRNTAGDWYCFISVLSQTSEPNMPPPTN